MTVETYTGRCLCGAVLYRADGPPLWVAHCHCESCRRNSGAAVLTFTGFAEDRSAYTHGAPARYESSPRVWRSFCTRCGTPLTYESARHGAEVHVTIGAFDEPERLPPTAHVWTEEQIRWLHFRDDLPRHRRSGRESETA